MNLAFSKVQKELFLSLLKFCCMLCVTAAMSVWQTTSCDMPQAHYEHTWRVCMRIKKITRNKKKSSLWINFIQDLPNFSENIHTYGEVNRQKAIFLDRYHKTLPKVIRSNVENCAWKKNYQTVCIYLQDLLLAYK